MRILREISILIWALFAMWIYNPIADFIDDTCNYLLGPCCDNPDPEWSENQGFSSYRCRNCGASRIYPRNI
jgi:hypothetical protein